MYIYPDCSEEHLARSDANEAQKIKKLCSMEVILERVSVGLFKMHPGCVRYVALHFITNKYCLLPHIRSSRTGIMENHLVFFSDP